MYSTMNVAASNNMVAESSTDRSHHGEDDACVQSQGKGYGLGFLQRSNGHV